MKSCLFIPFATLADYNTGANISQALKGKASDIYLKNLCVAAVSAKANGTAASNAGDRNGGGKSSLIECDIAVVVNFKIPDRYKEILEKWDIKIFTCPFDTFNLGAKYTWSLAYYKLCALKYMVENLDYDNYAFVDADVYVQDTLEYIWREANDKVLLLDINHGLQTTHYNSFIAEVNKFGVNGLITHYGGEFFAANRANSHFFIKKCVEIYDKMNSIGYNTSHGDEFITSIAASEMPTVVKNAGAYIYRYWTGGCFRLVSTNYEFNAISILHVPDHKMNGMIKIFDRYVVHGKLPSKRKIWSLLHLNQRSLRSKLSYLRDRLLNKV